MPIDEATVLASAWGEARRHEPTPGRTTVKVVIVHPEFEVVLLAEDGQSLTAVESWRFENDDADVYVEFNGLDVFRTPARELLQRISESGHAVEIDDENDIIYPDLT